MNIVHAFGQWLQDNGVGTLGQDIFISRAPIRSPTGARIQDRIFWLKQNGGGSTVKAVNGSVRKQYTIELYHRDKNTQDLYDELEEIGDDVTGAGCLVLEGYDVVVVDTAGPWTDNDLDSEERTVGLLQVTITIHKEN